MPEAKSNSILPPFVAAIREAAQELHSVLWNTPFPELDSDPQSDEEVAEVQDTARVWSDAVLKTYGSANRTSMWRGGLLGHFREDDPVVQMQLVREHPDGSYYRLVPELRDFNDDNAADVLGSVPKAYGQSVARTWAPGFGSNQRSQVGGPRGKRGLDATRENWELIRHHLTAKHRATMLQCAGLLTWIQGRLAAIENVLLPTISNAGLQPIARGGHQVEVTTAGFSRLVDLTWVEHQLLDELATSKPARATRKTKAMLQKKIPELRSLVHPTGRKQPSSASMEATYLLAPEMRGRVQLEPNSPPAG